MKYKIFTQNYSDPVALKKISANNRVFSSQEHTMMSENELAGIFNSYDNILKQWFRKNNPSKISSLIKVLQKIDLLDKPAVFGSFGSGDSVLEHLLKYAINENSVIISTDFDEFFVQKSKEFFKNISSYKFDMFNDNVFDLLNEAKTNIDCAIFMISSYALDDEHYIKILSDLKKNNVKYVIDFCGAFIDKKKYFFYIFRNISLFLKKNKILRKLAGKEQDFYQGKFHGYARSKNELRRIYGESKSKILHELSIEDFKYIAVLSLQD
jgi:hypothetical protein